MQLVIEKLALIVTTLNGLELSAASRISDRKTGCTVKNYCSTSRDLDSGLDHNLIDDLGVCLHLEVTLLVDADEAGQKSLAWDSVVVESKVSIVD